jgi:preprotein translocase subunit SecY
LSDGPGEESEVASSIANIFKIPELRKRIFFTLALLAVYRIGIFVSAPGVDREALKQNMQAGQGGLLNLLNFFTGGAMEQASVFALGIMPYITSSIIMQLLVVVIPALERLQKEGDAGRRKVNQYTRYGTMGISAVQAIMLTGWLKSLSNSGDPVVNTEWAAAWGGSAIYLLNIVTLTAGTAFIMWLGERITEKGIGNGISLIIFAGIVAGLPSAVYQTFTGLREGTYQLMELVVLIIIMAATVAAIVFIERGQRRIPVQYAKRIVGNKQATHLPLKVNTSGVIPPIFASSILMFPATASSLIDAEWMTTVQNALMPGTWLYQVVFIGMIIFFAFFYTAMTFNPVDVADNLKKFGGFVPGIRPGKATAEYIDHVLTRVTAGGAVYLAVVCVLPSLIQQGMSNQVPFYFGGTGLLIVVGVALDTAQQIEGHLIGPQGPRIRGRARTSATPTTDNPMPVIG